MPPIIEGPPDDRAPRPPWRRRLLWFAAIWIASAAAVAATAYILRSLIMWDT